MGLKISKKAYMDLIQEDLDFLNKKIKGNFCELSHIKVVLCSSIDWYYPDNARVQNVDKALRIADNLIRQLHDYSENIIAGSDEDDEHDKAVFDSCLEYLQLRKGQ
ncbi:MAG: hypothetical protein RSA53_05420 [Odoribacter sp.]